MPHAARLSIFPYLTRFLLHGGHSGAYDRTNVQEKDRAAFSALFLPDLILHFG